MSSLMTSPTPITLARTQARAYLTHNNRDYWIGLTWCILNSIAVIFDLWLVETGRTSISETVWEQTAAHPTLIAAGMMAGLGIARLVRRYWWMVVYTGVMTGHLWVHM